MIEMLEYVGLWLRTPEILPDFRSYVNSLNDPVFSLWRFGSKYQLVRSWIVCILVRTSSLEAAKKIFLWVPKHCFFSPLLMPSKRGGRRRCREASQDEKMPQL